MRTDLLRRIEKLEATNPVTTERKRVSVHFVAAKDGKPVNEIPGSARSPGAEAIVRSPNETTEAFEARAFEHFAELDTEPWPLVVLFS